MLPGQAKSAACGDPELLPLVDRAFGTTAGAAAAQREIRDLACVRCSIAHACLLEGLETGATGPWGGTTTRERNTARTRRAA
jgi:hypothetical protein